MTSILDFTIKYRSDDEQQTSEMFVSTSKSYKIKKIEQFRATNEKRGLIYILFFFGHVEINVAAILDFFFQILSSVALIPNPLCYYFVIGGGHFDTLYNHWSKKMETVFC